MTNNLFKNLLSLAVVASMVFLTSCGEDEEPLPTSPTISATSDLSTYDFGATAEITLDVTAPGELSGVNWTITVGEVAGDKVFNAPSALNLSDTETGLQTAIVTIDLDDDAFSGASFSIEFEVVDKANQTSTDVVTFEVGEMSPPASENLAVTLFGQLNAGGGSFYDVVADEVYGYATTRDEQSANVDFLFFYGSENEYTIAALDDADAITAFDAAVTNGDLGAFPDVNETRFKVLAEADEAAFDEVVTVADLGNLVGTDVAPEATKVSGLSAGDVFGFQFSTARGGVLGAVHITEVGGTQGSDRTISFEVKFEQPM